MSRNELNKIRRVPTHIFIGAYRGVETAGQVERVIADRECDLGSVICTNLAICTRDIAGQKRLREMNNPTVLESAASGAILGGLVGSMSKLMTGASHRPSILEIANDESVPDRTKALAASQRPSIITRVARHHIEGMDQTRLEKIGDALIPGSSAIICVFDEVLVTQDVYDGVQLENYHRDMDELTEHVVKTVSERLKGGTDVAFHAMVDEESGDVWWKPAVIGEGAVQVGDILCKQQQQQQDSDCNAAAEEIGTVTKGDEKTQSKQFGINGAIPAIAEGEDEGV
eukprot:jgi/Psemu1/292419/fgenesh1_pg.1044_\